MTARIVDRVTRAVPAASATWHGNAIERMPKLCRDRRHVNVNGHPENALKRCVARPNVASGLPARAIVNAQTWQNLAGMKSGAPGIAHEPTSRTDPANGDAVMRIATQRPGPELANSWNGDWSCANWIGIQTVDSVTARLEVYRRRGHDR